MPKTALITGINGPRSATFTQELAPSPLRYAEPHQAGFVYPAGLRRVAEFCCDGVDKLLRAAKIYAGAVGLPAAHVGDQK